jgi:hypothetical protein
MRICHAIRSLRDRPENKSGFIGCRLWQFAHTIPAPDRFHLLFGSRKAFGVRAVDRRFGCGRKKGIYSFMVQKTWAGVDYGI